ncbi:glycosyltransferase family 4 protein [Halocalculus aciditolerans]|uniref:Glycosyl transferase family 1 n=1 Tax=Halocalculus aciditolerans TaxID=1383812 RepID=A0A830F7R1_9EURY|nr:glycosyltransferase family 4 protein [Halocalculus aciditolerans]GGL62958.1 glycosyl transferase family 1 [Halocalculus aciditolerans]
MRVAFVTAETVEHGATTGVPERFYRLASVLAGRGHDVQFFTTQWWEGDVDAFEHEGLDYYAVAPENDWRYRAGLPGALRSFDPDVVHAAGDPPGAALAARVGARLANASYLVECYDPPRREGGLSDRFYRAAVNGASTAVVPSRLVATAYRERGIDGDAFTVVEDPIEWETITSADPVDAGDIVYSRRLDGAANLESLLLALAEFREFDWSATVIGDGPEKENYVRQARDLRIDDRVEFVGERTVEERIRYFLDAHVYVQTARRSSFPTDLLRALACGCVALVEYHVDSAAHELVEHEERGFLATTDEELVERLRDAAAVDSTGPDPDYERYGERAFVERYLDFYRADRKTTPSL